MIEQAFTLTTDLFEVTAPGPHFINPRCFGEDFAAWLRARLPTSEVFLSQPIQEDWGWALLVSFRGHRFTLFIGVMDESLGKTPAEWQVGVAYEKPLNGFRAWFRSAPQEDLAQLARILEETLRLEPRILQLKPA